jgi:hypothetical protein
VLAGVEVDGDVDDVGPDLDVDVVALGVVVADDVVVAGCATVVVVGFAVVGVGTV